MKIYFCGSIRGGRVDAALYRRIIAYIQRTDVVLTEHVGQPELNVLEQGQDMDAAIYERDTAWLRECDLVIAECTTPSLGVGYELAYAEKLNKPCFVFYRPADIHLSAMITGDPYYTVIPYQTKEELFEKVRKILS